MHSIITRLQTKLKINLNYFISGAFWLTAAKIVGLSTTFVTSVVLANTLSEEMYGEYRYLLSVLIILVIPTLPGMDTALTRSVAKGFDATFFSALKTKITWGLWGSVGSLGVGTYYLLHENITLGLGFFIAALFIPIMDPANIYLAFLSGKKNFKLQTYDQLIVRGIASILIIATVLLVSTNILVIFSVYLLSYTLLRLWFLWQTSRRIDQTTTADPHTSAYGKHLTLIGLPTIVSKTLDSLLVFHFVGPAGLAGYALAKIPLKQIQNIFASINVLALPSLAQRDLATVKKTLPKKIALSYIIIIPIVIAYWYVAETFFGIFYSPYIDFVLISQIYTLQALTFPLSIFDTALRAFGEKKRLYLHTYGTAILRTGLLVLLVPLSGVAGATQAILIAAVLGSIFLTIMFFSATGSEKY